MIERPPARRMRQAHPSRDQSAPTRGFTLVELLVALVILGLLMTALYGAFRFSAKALEAARRHTEQIEEFAAASAFLRERLSAAENVLITTGPRSQTASFTGTAQSLAFVAPMPAEISYGGLYYFRLTFDLAAGATRLDLALYRTREIFSLKTAADRRTRFIFPGYRPVFRYYGRAEPAPDAPTAWQDAWPPRGWLPQLVEIRLIPLDPEQTSPHPWPPLRIAIATSDR